MRAVRSTPAEIENTIRGFLATCQDPILFEEGDAPFRADSGRLQLEMLGGQLLLEITDGQRFLRRRLCRIETRKHAQRLVVTAERFGKQEVKVVFTDGATAEGLRLTKRASRWEFRERFLNLLHQRYPGWRVEACSIEQDLERTLSPNIARAWLERGR
jgi:hypothetical protein